MVSSDLYSLFHQLYDWSLNLIVGILGLYSSGYFIGKIMEIIIEKKRLNAILIGIIWLITILFLGVLLGSTVGFLEEIIVNLNNDYKFQDIIFDNYIKPLFWIFFIGIIPTIITVGIMGSEIKESINKI